MKQENLDRLKRILVRIESLRREIAKATMLSEEMEHPEQWQTHMKKFMEVFFRNLEFNLTDDEPFGYQRGETFSYAFNFWLDEVPDATRNDPEWRRGVEEFIRATFEVDTVDLWKTADAAAEFEPEPGPLPEPGMRPSPHEPGALPEPGDIDWDEIDRLFQGDV